jgi:hypothetical protein
VPEIDGRGIRANDSIVDRAAEASKRLCEAAGRVGDAYAGACHETVLGFADIKDKVAGSNPADWGRSLLDSLLTGGNPVAPGTLELTEAAKQIARAYIDAYERAALTTIDLRERLAAAAGAEWLQSLAGRRAQLEREAATACFALARGLLS